MTRPTIPGIAIQPAAHTTVTTTLPPSASNAPAIAPPSGGVDCISVRSTPNVRPRSSAGITRIRIVCAQIVIGDTQMPATARTAAVPTIPGANASPTRAAPVAV